jgi:hypothetical protein
MADGKRVSVSILSCLDLRNSIVEITSHVARNVRYKPRIPEQEVVSVHQTMLECE